MSHLSCACFVQFSHSWCWCCPIIVLLLPAVFIKVIANVGVVPPTALPMLALFFMVIDDMSVVLPTVLPLLALFRMVIDDISVV